MLRVAFSAVFAALGLVGGGVLAQSTTLPAVPAGPTVAPASPGAVRLAGMISGNGTAVLRPIPAKLRVQVQLQSHGKTVDLALERLKARREAVAGRLRSLKADKQSIASNTPNVWKVFPVTPGTGYYPAAGAYATPTVVPNFIPAPAAPPALEAVPATPVPAPQEAPEEVPEAAPRTLQPVTPIAMILGEPTSPAGKAEPRELFSASTIVTAEFPLEAETMEQALVFADLIRKRVLANDLTGAKSEQKLSAEERGLLDESRRPPEGMAVAGPVLPPGATEPGEIVASSPATPPPSFQYVATITSQQRKALLAEALGKARTQAGELAEATGGKLGLIRNLSGGVTGTKSAPGPFNPYMPACTPSYGAGVCYPCSSGDNDNEATAIDLGTLEFRANVSVQFELQ